MRLGSFQSHQGPFAQPADEEPVDLVGESESLRYMRMRIGQATNATVLLLGETGTGKGVAARLIHLLSPRGAERFVSVDCTSLPATLIESELFGREKGAFTDARSTQVGRCELAHGGTGNEQGRERRRRHGQRRKRDIRVLEVRRVGAREAVRFRSPLEPKRAVESSSRIPGG